MYYSNIDLRDLLLLATKGELEFLTNMIKPESYLILGADELVDTLSNLGGHSFFNLVRGNGVRYSEILIDISEGLGSKSIPPMLKNKRIPPEKFGYLNYDKVGQTYIDRDNAKKTCHQYALETEKKITIKLFEALSESCEGDEKAEMFKTSYSLLEEISIETGTAIPTKVTPGNIFTKLNELDQELSDAFLFSITSDYLKYTKSENLEDTTPHSMAAMATGYLSLALSTVFLPIGAAAYGYMLNSKLNERLLKLAPVVMMFFRIRARIRIERRFEMEDKIASKSSDSKETALRFIGAILNQYGSGFGETIATWLDSKREGFNGNEYIIQLEKNAVYLNESYQKQFSALVTFLMTDCELDSEFIDAHCQQAQGLAKDKTGLIVNYLRGGFDVPSSIFGVESYAALKELKGESESRYKEELEFQCSLYRSKYMIIKLLINQVKKDSTPLSTLGQLPEADLTELLHVQINNYSNLIISNLEIVEASN